MRQVHELTHVRRSPKNWIYFLRTFLEKVKPDFIKIKEGKLDDSVSNATKIVYCADTGDMKF